MTVEVFTPLGLFGGIGALCGYLMMGASRLSCFERFQHVELARALWPLTLAISLILLVFPAAAKHPQPVPKPRY
jgi:hypothetical protein